MTNAMRVSCTKVRWTAGLLAALAVTSVCTTSHAQGAEAEEGVAQDEGEQRQPNAYVDRPIALPAMTLAPGMGLSIFKLPGFTSETGVDPLVALSVGARFGIVDELEVEAYPFASLLSPSFQYAGFAGVTGDFLDGPFELGARFRWWWAETGFVLTPSIPMRIHIAEILRIDTGVAVSIPTENVDITGLYEYKLTPLNAEPGVPLNVAVQIVEPVWAGLNTGFGIAGFEDAGDRIFIPLGFAAGATIPGDTGPLVDIGAGFSFPFFVLTGATDTIVTEVWHIGLQAQGYLYL